jgi:hypothetical protein
MADSCLACVFFVKNTCHQSAPTLFGKNEAANGQWPVVAPDDWCGDGLALVDGHRFSAKMAAALVAPGPTQTPA